MGRDRGGRDTTTGRAKGFERRGGGRTRSCWRFEDALRSTRDVRVFQQLHRLEGRRGGSAQSHGKVVTGAQGRRSRDKGGRQLPTPARSEPGLARSFDAPSLRPARICGVFSSVNTSLKCTCLLYTCWHNCKHSVANDCRHVPPDSVFTLSRHRSRRFRVSSFVCTRTRTSFGTVDTALASHMRYTY